MTISIIIPIYNRLEVTKQGLESLSLALNLHENTRDNIIKFNIVVIDDGSSDGSSEWLMLNRPDIHLLKGDGNLWWSGSVNKAVKFAVSSLSSDYVLLWNDDIFVHIEYFKILANFIRINHPIKSILGSKICFENDENKLWSAGGYFSKWNGRKFAIRKLPVNIKLLKCEWQPGMGTLIPSFIFNKHNIWWDEKRYPQYYGDSDFTLRCHEIGIPITTYLELVIYNRTEFTGDDNQQGFKAFYNSLFSIRSFYEIKRNLMFYSQHGIIPFVYYGMILKYFLYFSSTIKNIFFNKKNSTL